MTPKEPTLSPEAQTAQKVFEAYALAYSMDIANVSVEQKKDSSKITISASTKQPGGWAWQHKQQYTVVATDDKKVYLINGHRFNYHE